MIEIDGSFGEGGGQILRSSLSLSVITGTPFRIRRIRANRSRSGLLHQHLTAVQAAAQICGAAVEGDVLHSAELSFRPRACKPGRYHFSVGTAGSALLVLQTVLLPLALAQGESEVTIEGGTHAEGAPTFDFVARAFLPLLARMKFPLELTLERAGFYPIGGGLIRLKVGRSTSRVPLVLETRGEAQLTARAVTAGLPSHIAGRELNALAKHFRLTPAQTVYDRLPKEWGFGNVLYLEAEGSENTEVLTSFGRKGKPAEDVAEELCREGDRFLLHDVPVWEHLADQLILPCAFAPGSAYRTAPATLHSTTNAQVLELFGLKMKRAVLEDGNERFSF